MFKIWNNLCYFPEETPEGGDLENENEETPQGKGIAEKLEELKKSVSSESSATAQLAKIVSDPTIRQYLEAQQQGKKAKLVLDAEESSTKLVPDDGDDGDEEIDLEELSRAQLLKYFGKNVVKTIAPLIEKRFKDYEDKLKPIQDVVGETQRSQVSAAIEQTKKKYPDFDKYRDKMVEINNRVGGTLGPEDLYILAKKESGTLFKQTGTESERPDAFGVPETKQSSGKYRGHSGLQKLLEDGINSAFDKLR